MDLGTIPPSPSSNSLADGEDLPTVERFMLLLKRSLSVKKKLSESEQRILERVKRRLTKQQWDEYLERAHEERRYR